MTCVIYGLVDPRAAEVVRYVGYSKDTKVRFKGHIGESREKETSHKHKWIRKLLREGVEPVVIILEEVMPENWQLREKFWIAELRISNKLTNSTEGGEGLVNPAKYIRRRIAKKVTASLQGNSRRKGIPHTAESKAAISSGLLKSKKFAKANKKKLGIDAHANMTEEQKQTKADKISAKKLGVKRAPFTAETKANMSRAHVGLKHKEETKTKIGNSQVGNTRALGNVMSEESKEAIRRAKLGTKRITDGARNKVLKAGESLPSGWRFGQIQRRED